MAVVLTYVSNLMSDISVLLSTRRVLIEEEDEKDDTVMDGITPLPGRVDRSTVRRSRQLPPTKGKSPRRGKKSKKKKKKGDDGPSEPKENPVASPEEIKTAVVDSILNNNPDDPNSAQNQLETAFSNKSFFEAVDGDPTAKATAVVNIEKIETGLNEGLDAVENTERFAALDSTQKAEFAGKRTEIDVQMDLLRAALGG